MAIDITELIEELEMAKLNNLKEQPNQIKSTDNRDLETNYE